MRSFVFTFLILAAFGARAESSLLGKWRATVLECENLAYEDMDSKTKAVADKMIQARPGMAVELPYSYNFISEDQVQWTSLSLSMMNILDSCVSVNTGSYKFENGQLQINAQGAKVDDGQCALQPGEPVLLDHMSMVFTGVSEKATLKGDVLKVTHQASSNGFQLLCGEGVGTWVQVFERIR